MWICRVGLVEQLSGIKVTERHDHAGQQVHCRCVGPSVGCQVEPKGILRNMRDPTGKLRVVNE